MKSLTREIAVLWYAYRDPETPLLPKIILFTALGYALSPVDLIPDFIPVLGHLDDALIVPLLAALSYRLIPAHVKERARLRAEKEFPAVGGKGRFAAVVLTWAAVLVLAVLLLVLIFR